MHLIGIFKWVIDLRSIFSNTIKNWEKEREDTQSNEIELLIGND